MTSRQLAIVLFLVTLIAVPLAAQLPTASLRGTVNDPSGAAVPGVSVTIKNTGTGVERIVTTDENGGYSAEGLSPGSYSVSTRKEGFASQTQSLELQVGRVVVTDFKLTVGSVEQQVTVSGAAPLVDPENSVVGAVVDPQAVRSLPLNGRQFGDLATLVPGVLPAPNFDPIKTRVFNVSASGSDGRSSNFSVDGGENSDIVNGGLLQNFTIEGIQEFYVSSSRFNASQGRALGAAVNVVTKSGTNDLHGSYFFFFRNQSLSAQDPFQAQDTDFRRFQHGFTLGGPVRKDRTFFFVAYENTNERNLGIVNTNGAFPTFEGSFELPYDSHLLSAKLDHQLTAKQKLTARYSFEDNASREGIGGIRSEENGISSTNRSSDLVLAHTYLISPRALNTFTYHFGHFQNRLSPLSLTPEVVRPELITGGAFNTPQATRIVRNQLRDDVSLSLPSGWGTHNLKFGFDYNRLDVKASLEFASRGQYFFFTPGTPLTQTLADFAFLSVGNFQFPDYSDNIIGAYFQDDWKVNRRLTLNLGLRWDVSTNENNPNFVSTIAPAGSRERDLNNWGPRVGFALDPTGSGKTVIRGGYGIFYALPVATDPAVESAFDGSRIGFGLFGPLDIVDPFPGLTQDQIDALVFAQPQFLLLTMANHVRTPYVQQFSIGVQQQLTDTMAVTVDYVHNLGIRQRLGLDVNIDPLGNIGSPDTILAQEFGAAVAASFGPVIRVDDIGKSKYNALEISLNKRFSRRFQFLAAYTLSHAVDMGDDSIGSTVANPFDLAPEIGDSNRDQRHRFVLSGSWSLPYDFELSTITAFASARPYDIVTGESLDGFSPSRPPGVTRNRGARSNTQQEIDSINSLRALAGLAPISTTSPRSFFFYSTDLRLTKRFKIGERVEISGIAELFNVFNHVNFLSNGGPTFSGVSGAQNNVFADDFGFPRRTAGGVLGSGGPRAAQLAFRISF